MKNLKSYLFVESIELLRFDVDQLENDSVRAAYQACM